jgi:hypothetical protein
MLRQRVLVLAFLYATLGIPLAAGADLEYSFEFDPPPGEILSASLAFDVAALTAHRYVGAYEVNHVELVDPTGGIAPASLSHSLFGEAAFGEPAEFDQGTLQTGLLTASIGAEFYPVLATGEVDLRAVLTDTYDSMFALDAIWMIIETSGDEVIEPLFQNGDPPPLANNGFGIGLPDGGELADPLPISIPAGATGTGFDETIASKSIVPEPGSLLLFGLLGMAVSRRRIYRIATPGKHAPATCAPNREGVTMIRILTALAVLGLTSLFAQVVAQPAPLSNGFGISADGATGIAASPLVDPIGDYGDAPDNVPIFFPPGFYSVEGRFPTRFGTANSRYGLPGAHTVDVSQDWLGEEVSREAGAYDPSDPDGLFNLINTDRYDDGVVLFPCPADPPLFDELEWVDMVAEVTLAPVAPEGPRYLNVLIDIDHDGAWADPTTEGTTEWVVRDYEFVPTPGETTQVFPPEFLLPAYYAPGWMRVMVSRQRVADVVNPDESGWDGSGQFQHGEVEDYASPAMLFAVAAADTAEDRSYRRAEDTAVAWAWATSWASAWAIASANASADAGAAAAAAVEAEAYADEVDSIRRAFEEQAEDIQEECMDLADDADDLDLSCEECPCASACALAGGSAHAMAEACAQASAVANATVYAASVAVAEAEAKAAAAAIAAATAQAEANAIAASYAEAQAWALAFAGAAADAEALAESTADARAAAAAAFCQGNWVVGVQALAEADAHSRAAADSFHFWYNDFGTFILTFFSTAASEASAARAAAVALASAEATAYIRTEVEISIELMASAEASAEAMAEAVAEVGAAAFAACNGDCCPDVPTCVPDQLHLAAPVPVPVTTGEPASVVATVESDFVPVWTQSVVFESLHERVQFTNGEVSPNGFTTIIPTNQQGEAVVEFVGLEAGQALIRVSVANSTLSSAFSTFVIVDP